jgi:hypothetical protein
MFMIVKSLHILSFSFLLVSQILSQVIITEGMYNPDSTDSLNDYCVEKVKTVVLEKQL